MCGIFFLRKRGLDRSHHENLIRRSMEPLLVRGPDGSDTFWGKDFVLGHTRLAIIDPTQAASQPFMDESGRYLLSYNGEIYNYEELRDDLLFRGAKLRTHSDTEVLLELLVRDGWDRTAKRLRGMFAFILVEKASGRVLAARDHFGQKPFYYFQDAGDFGIASDPACFFPLGQGQRPDRLSYNLYANTKAETGTRGIYHPKRSMFERIHVLPAGHAINLNGESLKVTRYFAARELYDAGRAAELRSQDESELLEKLAFLLRQSVRRHLVSDVPVGCLLSGGVDSSIIHWFASEFSGDLTAFVKVSPGIEEIPQSVVPELLRRRPASAFYHVLHPQNYVRELLSFIGRSHAPSRWGGGPPMNAICSDARRNGVHALLGGDCADEMFGGYEHYEAAVKHHDETRLGESFEINHTGPFALHEGVEEYEQLEWSVRREIQEVVSGEQSTQDKFAQVMLIHDASSFIQVCNLPNSDTFSMLSSVELRNPMLDLDLAEFAINLPPRHKVARHESGHFGKRLLRQLVEREMGSFMQKRKEGTRNFAMAAAQLDHWQLDNFSVLEELGPPQTPLSKRQMVRLINLEIFHQLHFRKAKTDGAFLAPLLTDSGRQAFGIG